MTTDEAPRQPRLRMSDHVLTAATAVVRSALPREIGGILVGWHEGECTVVTDVLSVPDKKANGHHYRRSHKRAQRVLDRHRKHTPDPNVGYVGEWHSHPAPQPPSTVDLNSLAEITEGTEQAVVLVVFAVSPDGIVAPLGAVGQRREHTITIQELDIESEPS